VLRGAPGSGTVPITKGLNGLSKVPEQVPSIGDLHGPWSALTNPVGIGSGTIAGDDLDARPITQPSGNGGSFAIWQEIDHLVRLEVYQHCAVASPASPCPIIDAEHARHWLDLSGTAARRETQKGIRTRRSRDARGQSRSGFAAESKPELMLKISQPPGAAAKRIRHIHQTLGKRAASAVSVRAMIAASRNVDGHWTTLPREIMQHAPVGTVNAPRRLAAHWACRRRRAWRCLDGDALGCWNHQRYSERSWNERQQGRGHERTPRI